MLPSTAASRTCFPVTGYAAPAQIAPMSTEIERANRSAQKLSIVYKTTLLPRSSAMANGLAPMPCIVSVTSWTSGYARPMQSPSTTGMPTRAAMKNGTMELMPPISTGMTA